MFTSLLLTASLAGGQPPASVSPLALPGIPAAGQPAAMPPGIRSVIQDPAPKDGGAPETPKEEEEKPPATKYLLERSLAETRLGDILSNRGITVYGWTAFSYNVSTASKTNAPVFMIDRANQFLLNQNYLVAEKTLDTSKKEFQWGWRTDWVLPGSDARTSVVRGLWDDQLRSNNGGPQLYPIDLYQAYVQAFLPNIGEGTTVKVGRFATHCEYELFQAPDRPFVSTSYLFQYNPFTHTGLWAVTQLNDTWSVGNGIVTGNDTFFDQPTNRATYIGQIKWAPKEGKTSVLFNAIVTNPQFNAAEAFAYYNVYNLQVTHKFNDKLTYVLDTAFSHITDVPNIGNTNWYGAANYLIYAHNDKVTSTLRAEVFEDTSGFRTGFSGLYTEVTYGVAYKAMNGLIIRPSIRYDNNSESQVWEGSQNLFTAAVDVILRW